MTIASEIQRIGVNISNAYSVCQNKGATMPVTQNSANLADCIDSITTGSGGGSSSDSGGEYLVQVIDYDGTILKQDHLDSGATFTLPSAPSHTGLIFQEWSSPVIITNDTVTVEHDIIIGAVYTTVSGKSEFDIKITDKTGKLVYLNLDGNKDWGDGTINTETSHTYEDYGEYTIICDGTSTPNTSNGIFNQPWNGNRWITDPLESSGKGRGLVCTAARLAGGLGLYNYSFLCCDNMEYITMDNTVHPSDNLYYTVYFSFSTNLKALIFPQGFVTNSVIPNRVHIYFRSCGLNYFIIPRVPDGIIYLSGPSSSDCPNLFETFVTPDDTLVTFASNVYSHALRRVYFGKCDFTSSGFNICYPTKHVHFDNDTVIPSYINNNSRGVKVYRFTNYTSVPSLSNSNGLGELTAINRFLKIYVPASLESEWKTATNWVGYADYIEGV